MQKELVIAIFSRNYDWIGQIDENVKIKKYNKNTENIQDGEILISPNLGRDVHTFFYHIVNEYDNLSEYTIFSQDYPFDHVSNYIEIINGDETTWELHAKQKSENCWFFCTEHPILTCDLHGNPNHPGLEILPVWENIFENSPPSSIQFTPSGHFIISKNKIHEKPKSYYENILKILETNEESPWVIERLEPYIFNLI
jgi:hypothetical protein